MCEMFYGYAPWRISNCLRSKFTMTCTILKNGTMQIYGSKQQERSVAKFCSCCSLHRHLRKDRLINGSYRLPSLSHQYCQWPLQEKKPKCLGKCVASRAQITKLQQSILFRYLWLTGRVIEIKLSSKTQPRQTF